MDPTSSNKSGQLVLSSYGPHAQVADKEMEKYTFKAKVDHHGIENPALTNLQPLTVQLTHTFPNITKFNNKIFYNYNGVVGFFTLTPDYQYSLDALINALNEKINTLATVVTTTKLISFDEELNVLQATYDPVFASDTLSFLEQNNGEKSTLWSTLGLTLNSSTFTLLDGGTPTPFLFPYSPNLRGPECIYISISGVGKSNFISSQKVSEVKAGQVVFTDNDDLNTHLCIPIQTEYGGVIYHTFQDTYSNSYLYNNHEGRVQNDYTVTLYDHKKRILHLHPDGVCNIFFRVYFSD